jgi:hypothetical protein
MGKLHPKEETHDARRNKRQKTERRTETGRRPKVGSIMIKCPQTGRAIPTGMTAEREKFRCSTVFFARTYCSICRTNHEWFAREAWVSEPSDIAQTVC